MQNQWITLGGGCFWCLEAVYQELVGVEEVISGYAGGFVEHPDYESVCEGITGHAEVVQIHFNPQVISLRQILEVFFVIHDPTTLNRQGHDVGTQYRSVIYCEDETQIQESLDVIHELTESKVYKDPVVTEIMMAPVFYAAEDYHQNYFVQHPFQGYCMGVVAPKLAKFRKTFAQLQKKSN
jgi:peptide-methionine (S)-S-oxide reductase